jgi:hypothetical protein
MTQHTEQHDSENHRRCANPGCRRELAVDHVTLVTTCHVRRFCSVDCISEGHKLTLEAGRA